MIPVPGYSVGTPYGRRGSYWSCSKDSSGNGIHTGVDYPAPTGTKVVAARPGTAVYCSHGSSFGYHQLEVRCGDGTRDFYAHMPTRTVANGAKVQAGQQIGTVGSEGNVTGPHLHFERHATETGGWSCSVVRDPAPSINYAASGGSGSGGSAAKPKPEVEDMPDYIRARLTKPLKVKAETWTSLPWDAVDQGGKYLTKGDQAIYIGKKSVTLTLTADPTTGGDSIRTRFLERVTEKGVAVTKETWPATEHKVTGGATYLNDSRTQYVSDGRRLVAQIWLPDAATLSTAQINLLVW